MKILKVFTLLIAISLTIGLIACSDDTKDDAATDEGQQQEQVQDTPQQQGGQQMQQGQQQQNTQAPPQNVKIGTKADVVKFMKKSIEWIESPAFIDQMRKTIPKAQTPEENTRIMAENKKIEDKFIEMAESSGIPNQQSFQATMDKFKDDQEVKDLQQKLNTLMQSKMQVIQQEMMQQMQKQQTPQDNK
jgi:hypothetical protein